MFIVNGHVLDNIDCFIKRRHTPKRKRCTKHGRKVCQNVSASLGPDFPAPASAVLPRFADYDNDGDIDILVRNNGQAAELLHNDGGNQNHWMEVRLYGTRSNRDGIGARVVVKSGGATLVEEAKGGMSYQSSHDPRLHFGLGAAARVDSIEVRWPSGVVDRLAGLAVDRIVGVKEGAGETAVPYRPLRSVTALRRGN